MAEKTGTAVPPWAEDREAWHGELWQRNVRYLASHPSCNLWPIAPPPTDTFADLFRKLQRQADKTRGK